MPEGCTPKGDISPVLTNGRARSRLLSVRGAWREHPESARALRDTLLGGLGLQFTLLVTGVVVARALGPEDRGHFGMLTLVAEIAFLVAGLGLPFALTFAVARSRGGASRLLRRLKGPLLRRMWTAPLLAGLALVPLVMTRPDYVQLGAAVVVLAVAPAFLQQCGLGVLQGLHRFRTFNLLRVAPNALFAILVSVLLVSGRGGFAEIAVAWAFTRAALGPWTMRKAVAGAREEADEVSEVTPVKTVLAFGRRSMLGAAPPMQFYRVDQAVVVLFLTPAALGLYIVALAMTNLPRFVAHALGLVATPLVASSPTHVEARRRMWMFAGLAAVCIPIVGAMWVAAPALVDLFFGSEFSQAAALTRLLLIDTLLYCFRRVLTEAARGAGYPGLGSIAEAVALGVACVLFAVLVPGFGLDGVAYALIGASTAALLVLVALLLTRRARKSVPDAWEPRAVPDTL